ncbi:hypothetical protein Sjap_020400 [Stephania japonica]|uniref:Uncharacterized protein n=1 Tax=Stephania japonica TaxID=461633 RepID=A0AAP0F0L9_9MAGN
MEFFFFTVTAVWIQFSSRKTDNLDEGPKFDDDGCNLVEDKVVFGDDGFIIKVVSHNNPQMLGDMVGDVVVNKSSMNNFSNYQNFVVSVSDDEVKTIFEDKVIMDRKVCEGTKI